MREIKFRAWIKSGFDEDIKPFMTEVDKIFLSEEAIEADCEYWNFEDVVLMQYTGLKDKNGKEIYEGDIVDIIHPCWTNKCTVEFINGSFVFKSKELVNENTVVPGFSFMREIWKVEIIGNIYNNSELLK
jgi:uncharacterized phage protein (TIGR01671 family)